MERITQVDGVGDVEKLPAVRRLDTIIAAQVERVDRSGPVRLAVGICSNDAQGLLEGVVRLNHISACVAAPRDLSGIVVSVQVIGCLVEIAIPISGYRII